MKTHKALILPFLLATACSWADQGANDSVIGEDGGEDEIGGQDPLIDVCYGLPYFNAEEYMTDLEKQVTPILDSPPETGEVSCYVPKLGKDKVGWALSIPSPLYVPDMGEGLDLTRAFDHGLTCNFLGELPGSDILSTDAGEQIPWYTGPFIDNNSEFTGRYTACWEECASAGIANEFVNGSILVNTFCKEHLDRHTIDPDGNGWNDGVPLHTVQEWNLNNAYARSSCESPESTTSGSAPPIVINANVLYQLVASLIPFFGNIIIEETDINDVPWTWNWWFYTGGCQYQTEGYKEIEANTNTWWLWATPCPNNYFSVIQVETLEDFIDGHGNFMWAWTRNGYCYADGMTVSGIKPPPNDQMILANLEENGVLTDEEWDALILVQHGGGKSWPQEGRSIADFDRLTASMQLHPDLVSLMVNEPELLLEGVETRLVFREDGSGDPKPALQFMEIPPGSLLDALGYQANDIIFSIRGKDEIEDAYPEGRYWENVYASLHGDFLNEWLRMISLSYNFKSVTVMHERHESVDIPSDHPVRKDHANLPKVIEDDFIRERHYFLWSWQTPVEVP